jgi:K+-sensing histidine kinase KdpD
MGKKVPARVFRATRDEGTDMESRGRSGSNVRAITTVSAVTLPGRLREGLARRGLDEAIAMLAVLGIAQAVALVAAGTYAFQNGPRGSAILAFMLLFVGLSITLGSLALRNRQVALRVPTAQVEEVKTEILNQVAHGLQSPLMPVRIHLHLLESDLGEAVTERQRKSLRVMERNLARLGRIVDQVLLAGQLQTHRLKLAITQTRLDALVRQAVETAKAEAFEGAPPIEMDASEALTVQCDPNHMRLVLRGALEEALRRTSPTGKVRISATRQGGEARIHIEDGGLADPDDVGVFERFASLHARNAGNEHDLGLALHVGRGVLERHGGRLWIECQDSGRTVCLALPAQA